MMGGGGGGCVLLVCQACRSAYLLDFSDIQAVDQFGYPLSESVGAVKVPLAVEDRSAIIGSACRRDGKAAK